MERLRPDKAFDVILFFSLIYCYYYGFWVRQILKLSAAEFIKRWFSFLTCSHVHENYKMATKISSWYDWNWIQCQICFELHKLFDERKHPFSAKSPEEWRTDCRSLQNKFSYKMYGLKWEETWSDFSKTKGRIFLKLLVCSHRSVWSDSHMYMVGKLFGNTLYLCRLDVWRFLYSINLHY